MIEKNIDLASLNTLCISASADYYAAVKNKKQLKQIVAERSSNQPVLVLGGGSNVLFVNDYQGLVLQPKIYGRKIVQETDEEVFLKVGAGENWHQLVRYCVGKGWGGIENLSLIPGWAGAAPIQNIGAYGVEFDQVFHSLTAIEIATGKEKRFNRDDCDFGYRDSIFKRDLKNKYVIADVTIKLQKNPRINTSYGSIQQQLAKKNIKNPTIRDISDIVIEIRNKKLPDPSSVPNAGSFFKNPIVELGLFKSLQKKFPDMPHYSIDHSRIKIPAGWLIERAGWKAKEKKRVGVYQQQALVIINKGGATGQEILALAHEIQHSVEQLFDIHLMPEVNIIES